MNDAHVIYTLNDGRRFCVGPPHAALNSNGELIIDPAHPPNELVNALISGQPVQTQIWLSPSTNDTGPYNPQTTT